MARKRAEPTAGMSDDDAAQLIAMALVAGQSQTDAIATAIAKGATRDRAEKALGEARRRITLAAEYNRDEQIGRAIMRLEALFSACLGAAEHDKALGAQKEINKLLALHAKPGQKTNGDGAIESAELGRVLALIAGHLEPLGLAPRGSPVQEHARLAAHMIRTHGLLSRN